MQSVKCADNTKFRETVDKLEGKAAVHRDLDGLEEWAKSNLMKLSVHMQSPAPGKEQPHAAVQAGFNHRGK